MGGEETGAAEGGCNGVESEGQRRVSRQRRVRRQKCRRGGGGRGGEGGRRGINVPICSSSRRDRGTEAARPSATRVCR